VLLVEGGSIVLLLGADGAKALMSGIRDIAAMIESFMVK
jgi:hypothetical protein